MQHGFRFFLDLEIGFMGFEIGFWGLNLLVQLGFIWGLKKESAPESTPLIEK
jgi:hypothetical protein